jgi:glyoxylase-like metal-dependent hydrolase (beta-lactamase superfamily II)
MAVMTDNLAPHGNSATSSVRPGHSTGDAAAEESPAHTPGHTPGHVSLWRERDRVLIAGDAFITTRQESVYAAVTQTPEMHGPPMYFTPDWVSAKASVRELAALGPEIVVTGHGAAMQGAEMRAALDSLALRFDEVAVPESQQR